VGMLPTHSKMHQPSSAKLASRSSSVPLSRSEFIFKPTGKITLVITCYPLFILFYGCFCTYIFQNSPNGKDNLTTEVTCILRDLVQAIIDTSNKDTHSCCHVLTRGIFQCAASEPTVKRVIKRAEILMMDVTSVPAEKKLSFYTNVCNLMSLHALLNAEVSFFKLYCILG